MIYVPYYNDNLINCNTSLSQILTDPRHHFSTSSIYKNVTLVAWDPAPYNVNLHKVLLFSFKPFVHMTLTRQVHEDINSQSHAN